MNILSNYSFWDEKEEKCKKIMKIQKEFIPEQFTPTKWNSAEQKAKFCYQFVSFVQSDFSQSKFPQWFYQRLSNCFGFIAHCDRLGFYKTYFIDSRKKCNFINDCMTYPCCGDVGYTYSDAEKILKVWLSENQIELKVLNQAKLETEKYERAELNRLKLKYEQ